MSTEPEKGSNPQPKPVNLDIAAIVRQLEDLVKLSMECEEKELKPDVSFLDVHNKLLAIRRDIERYQENYKQYLAQFNLRPEDVKPTPEAIEDLGPKEKQILEKLKNLQSTCEDARDRLYESMQADQATLRSVKGELKEKGKEKIHRKGKFKGVGGKQGWIPT
jgi:hypothetical protein